MRPLNARCTTRTWTASTGWRTDRKSTRLNSSHGYISYAVFCLKKKRISTNTRHRNRRSPFEMKLAVLTDFDGTVTLNDTFQNVAEKYAKRDLRAVTHQYVNDEI